MAKKYVCRYPHHEDLTKAVEAMRDEQERVIARVDMPRVLIESATGDRLEVNADEWRVVVTCSKGHKNVFRGRREPRGHA